ncbi:hypothetical protein BHE74_00006336 [Ensete ventricosum]|nr:hypothetical protein BHE74_00006336 [Ensete ventricosum]
MSQVLQISTPPHNCTRSFSSTKRWSSSHPRLCSSRDALLGSPDPRWAALQRELRCEGRHTCLFADNRKQVFSFNLFLKLDTFFYVLTVIYFLFWLQEQARQALESALGEKKTEFEKWSKEIEKRQEKGGGGASGRGGWFGGGGWFGWFGEENFWEEAQQAILTIVGIVSLVSKQMPYGA